ncbi:hypothetical protein CH281_18500 [Rhodococcus sp. 06-221-2]|uniref:DUF3263 domain-containing protein n=1 Tax=Nocardiaceae TaxID=85025 RepID=UPI000B9A42DC|nr:DUF3263 domain-containing protein [Rhodococcus sp. 06-221-2]NIL84661.1 hypothetical protein [Rhodococcus fascians]NIL91542.1 hypothetical protein [Rhodococcus fascians]OZD00371.1 hypothetical protein CH281_18500 [Rhodococcus sp. 06-221-2]
MSKRTEDEFILDFARKWEPYGGADTLEILLLFGLSVDRYKARLTDVLTGQSARGLDAGLRSRLLLYAAAR